MVASSSTSRPPTFDFSSLFPVAQDLAADKDNEAALRSAVNRAYYAAYGTARALREGEGLVVSREGGSTHVQVWVSFKGSEVRRLVKVASDRLKRKRQLADYEANKTLLPSDAVFALKQAQEILDLLDLIRSEQENTPR